MVELQKALEIIGDETNRGKFHTELLI